ncbi:MAG: DNA polymerase domain-containing protein [Deltaproteobacteria bacterium]|nr:DNA polymerase domain-containing protein [Deltaproteobacteria bacterium]
MAREPRVELEIDGRIVTVSSPGKVVFPRLGLTKLDLIRYYAAVAQGAMRGVRDRPVLLKRFVDGAEGEPFFQKRAPGTRPDWIETVELSFPSGRTAHEVVIRDAATLLWTVQIGCIDLNPHPVRAGDLEHPDELRIDLDPIPGVPWSQVREVAMVTRGALEDLGLVGWPKTSGSRGMHVNVRIEPRWTFDEVRRAALAIAREVERRAPEIATSRWWKEERRGVFLDYNQNAKDRTVASVYSVRPTPDARVSTPLRWDEVPTVEAEAFTVATVPARFESMPDPVAGIDDAVCSLASTMELAASQEDRVPRSPRTRSSSSENEGVTTRRRSPTERRRSAFPMLEIARADKKEDALAGLERWKARHPGVVPYLEPADILVDAMRGRYRTWTRIRVNLVHVPEAERPPQEALEADYDPWRRGRDSGSEA